MERVKFTNLEIHLQAHSFHKDPVMKNWIFVEKREQKEIWNYWELKKEILKKSQETTKFQISKQQKYFMINELCNKAKGR